jgi:hypothetical protein
MFFQSILPSFSLQQGAAAPNLQNLIPGGIQMAPIGEGDDIEGEFLPNQKERNL